MAEVDFSQATFRFGEFRALDLLSVRWPADDQHIFINNYREKLKRVLESLEGRSDVNARTMRAVTASMLKWAGDHQRTGIVARADLIEVGGRELAEQVTALLQE